MMGALATVIAAVGAYNQYLRQAVAAEGTLKEAKLQTTAAQSAAKAAGDTLHISQRAYIVVSEMRQDPSEEGAGYFRITPVIKNSGTTPATDVAIKIITPETEIFRRDFTRRNVAADLFVDWKVGAPRDPDDSPEEFFSSGVSKFLNLVIGGGSSLTASDIGADLNKNASIESQSNKIGRFFYGVIRYRDIFDQAHISKFCFRIDGFKTAPNGLLPQQSVCTHWNCIDAQCQTDRENYDVDAARALREYEGEEGRFRQFGQPPYHAAPKSAPPAFPPAKIVPNCPPPRRCENHDPPPAQ